MKLLELHLLAIDEQQFKILVRGDGQTDSLVTTSKLPFYAEDGTNWRRTALRCVETSQSFQARHFPKPAEQAWMHQSELLTPNCEFSPNLQAIIGAALYDALFPPDTPSKRALYTALDVARRANEPLHIRFKFSPKSSERSRLADYPWELIFKEDINDFLFQQRDIVCSRWLAYEDCAPSPQPIDLLRVWVISSRPNLANQSPQVLSSQEEQAIRTALESETVDLEVLPNARLDEFSDRLLTCPPALRPQVIHFDGHGLYGQRCPSCGTLHDSTRKTVCNAIKPDSEQPCGQKLPEPEGWLMFENEQGRPEYVSAKKFASALQDADIALVVLSACQSAMGTVASSQFNGAAQRLIAQRVPAVVAMQYAVEERAASRFCSQLYRNLSQYRSIASAVAAARQQMDRQLPQQNQWYRPVLYLRSCCDQGGNLLCSAVDLVPLTQPLTQLYRILQPHQTQLWPTICDAYRMTLPAQFESQQSTQTLRQKLAVLETELPQQQADEWGPTARFADSLFKAFKWQQDLPEGLQTALEDWAEKVEPRLAESWRERSAQGQLVEDERLQLQITLRLSVRPARQEPEKYHLIAALARDGHPRELEEAEPASASLMEAAAIAYHEIPAWLDELVILLCDQEDLRLSELAVECCLPLELLYLALDIDWSIQVSRRRRLPLSTRCQSLVVRALDRHLPADNRANAYVSSQGEWKANWKHANQNAHDAWSNYVASSSVTMPEMLDDFMKKNCFTAWHFHLPPTLDEREDLLDGMLGEGVPIALWLRAPAISEEQSEVSSDASKPEINLKELLKDPNQTPPQEPKLFELPQAVTTARKQPGGSETAWWLRNSGDQTPGIDVGQSLSTDTRNFVSATFGLFLNLVLSAMMLQLPVAPYLP